MRIVLRSVIQDPGLHKMQHDFLLGFIRIHILHHASQGPVYGLALIEELARHGYNMSAGTLYPVLHGLEEGGYLQREDRLVDGRIRKYYTVTALGIEALDDTKAKIRELVDEVLWGNGPQNLPDNLERSEEPKRL